MNDEDEDNQIANQIKITLKPMNIQSTAGVPHKREVEMTVFVYDKVGDFAQTLINIMGLKGNTGRDANFLVNGKNLDHEKSFGDQNVPDGAKIIFTLKRRVVVNPDDPAKA